VKIIDLKTHLLTGLWDGDPGFPHCLHATAIIRIVTDSGEDGLGEATLGYFTPELIPTLVEYYKPVLLGQNPMDIVRLERAMFDSSVWWGRQAAARSVQSALEMALWDLKAKALGVPAYQLMGGAARDRIPVYASGGPSSWPIDRNLARIELFAEKGFRTVKLATHFYELDKVPASKFQGRLKVVHLPHAEKIRRIEENFASLRKTFGSEIDFAIDGHEGGVASPIRVTEAIEIAECLREHRLVFYEEPLAYTDLDGYIELRRRSVLPIAGGESLSGMDQFHPFIARQGVHLIQPDVGFVGGISEATRIIHAAEAWNIRTAFHCGGSVGPCLAASWHMAAAIQSVDYVEMVIASSAIRDDVMIDRMVVQNGSVGLPTAPGLGVHLPPELLEKYAFVPNSGERT
jgi:L-alanine-DL-glutamate epimerase-like enolase superfamily enzyme